MCANVGAAWLIRNVICLVAPHSGGLPLRTACSKAAGGAIRIKAAQIGVTAAACADKICIVRQ
jgi:hypothetical protein